MEGVSLKGVEKYYENFQYTSSFGPDLNKIPPGYQRQILLKDKNWFAALLLRSLFELENVADTFLRNVDGLI